MEFKDLIHMRSNFTQAQKDKYFVPDRDLYDATLVRSKQVKQLVVVLCNTADEPLCIVRASNISDTTTETYPYRMSLDRKIKVENVILENASLASQSLIGRLEEVVIDEVFTVHQDVESYHLRNFDANFDSASLSKLVVFFKQAKEQFGVSPYSYIGVAHQKRPVDASQKNLAGERNAQA